MSRTRVAAWTAAVIAAASFSLSCADTNPTSFLILGNKSPEDDCAYIANVDGPWTIVQYDCTASVGGVINPGLRTFLVAQSFLSPGEGVTRVISITGADVELVATNYVDSQDLVAALRAAAADRRSPPVAGFTIDPGGAAVFPIDLIDPNQRAVISANFPAGVDVVTIEARITVHGSVDGNNVDAEVFRTPITLVNGLLTRNLGDCASLANGTPIRTGGCEPFTAPIDCCTLSGTTYCPAFIPE